VPTYQYACTACGHQLDAVQSFADDPLTECPLCEGRLRKLFGSVGIVFKGSGFYRTDSRAAAGDRARGGGSADQPDGGSADQQKGGSADQKENAGSADQKNGSSPGGRAKSAGETGEKDKVPVAAASTNSPSSGSGA
jgi:putative FmdB family regulatory protein